MLSASQKRHTRKRDKPGGHGAGERASERARARNELEAAPRAASAACQDRHGVGSARGSERARGEDRRKASVLHPKPRARECSAVDDRLL